MDTEQNLWDDLDAAIDASGARLRRMIDICDENQRLVDELDDILALQALERMGFIEITCKEQEA